MPKFPYLKKIGKKYYFRRRIPKHLIEIVGRGTQYKTSLKTSDEPTAHKRYAKLLDEYNDVLEEAERQLKGAKPHSLDGLDVNQAVRAWFLAKYHQMRENDINPFEDSSDRQRYIIECLGERDFWSRGHPDRISADLQRATDQVLLANGFPCGPLLSPGTSSKARQGVNVDRGLDKYMRLEELVRKSLLELQEQELIRLGVRISKTPVIPLLKLDSVYTATHAANKLNQAKVTEVTLQALIEEFFKDPAQQFSKRMRQDMNAAFRYLTEIVGHDIQVKNITRQDFKKIRDYLGEMPKNARKLKRTENLSLEALIEDGKKYNREIMTAANAAKRLSSLKRLMNFAVQEGYLDKNLMNGIVAINLNPEAKKNKRDPFDKQQLQSLLNSKDFCDEKSKQSAMYWAPLVSLFQGFRMEEILQLRKIDIKTDEDSGIVYFDIHHRDKNNLKTSSSVRTAPIHPELNKLGFMEFIDQLKTDRLFPEVTFGSIDRYSKKFSQKFSRNLENIKSRQIRQAFIHFDIILKIA